MAMINIFIEGVSYQVEAGTTVLEAAKACGYDIPTLCAYNHGECSKGSCRVCLVEIQEGRRNDKGEVAYGPQRLVASCVYPITPDMVDNTKIFDLRLWLGIFFVGVGYVTILQTTKVWTASRGNRRDKLED